MKYILMILALTLPLTACGHKGKLQSPEQIDAEAAKDTQAPSAGGEPEKEEKINVSSPELEPQSGTNLNETRPHSPSVGNY